MAIQTLNVTKSGNGSGTVTSDIGGLDCGSTCSVAQVSGNTVTLTASPSRGSIFVRWTGDLVSTSNPASYVQTLNPTNINAEFIRSKKGKVKGVLGPQNDVYFSPDVFPDGIPEVLPYNGSNYIFNSIGQLINNIWVPASTNRNVQGLAHVYRSSPLLVKFSKSNTGSGGSQRVSGGGSGNHRVSGGGSGNH